MRTTESPPEHPAATPPGRPRAPKAVARAWVAIALIPVFFFIAMGVGEGLASLLGYPADGAAPVWVTVATDLAATVTVLVPCLAAVFFGHRAITAGDRRGLLPAVLGAGAGLGWLILAIVSEAGDLLR
jgi:fatty acid desaturase